MNEIPTPESDAAEIVQTFRELPASRTGRVPLAKARDLERRLFITTRQRDQLLTLAERSTDSHACTCSGCAADLAEFLRLKAEIASTPKL